MNGEAQREKHYAEFLYDFDVDGGALGLHDLGSLPLGAIVTEVAGVVEAAVTSDGNATIIVGTTDDDNGWVAQLAKAVLVANAPVGTGIPAAPQPMTNDDDSRDVQFKVETAALTAGRVRLVLGYYIPSNVVITE